MKADSSEAKELLKEYPPPKYGVCRIEDYRINRHSMYSRQTKLQAKSLARDLNKSLKHHYLICKLVPVEVI